MITNIFFSLYFVTDLIIDFGGSRVKNLLIERVPEITISFVPPLVCFFYITYFGFGVFKTKFI